MNLNIPADKTVVSTGNMNEQNYYSLPLISSDDVFSSAGSLLSLVLSNTKESFLLLDRKLQIRLYSNITAERFQTFFGKQVEIGKSILDYMPAEISEHYLTGCQKALDGLDTDAVVDWSDYKGEDLFVQSSFRPARDADGHIHGVLLTSSTITEKMLAQKAADTTRENLRILLSNTDEAFIMVDRNRKVLLFNKSAGNQMQRLLGKELLIGTDILDYNQQPEQRQMLEQRFEHIFLGETVVDEQAVPDREGLVQYFAVQYKPAYNQQNQIVACIINTRNITQTKLAEQKLMENEHRWRFALEGSNQGVWDWNLETGEVIYSAAWRKLLGYPEEEIENSIKAWEDLLHPDDRELMRRHRVRHIASKNPYYESEYRLKAKDGTYRWILSRGLITAYLPDGRPHRMIGTHTDITGRKLIEEKYKLLFYKNPLPMWTYDRETLKFLEVNDAAVNHYGYTRQQFLLMTIKEIRPLEDVPALLSQIQIAKNNDIISSQHHRHQKKNGETIQVNISGYNFEEGGRKVTLIIAEDITQKLKAEQRLKRSETIYRLLFKHLPLPALIYDPESLQILEANDAAVDHYGYAKKEFLHLPMLHLYIPEQHEKVREYVAQNVQRQQTSISQWVHRKKDGTLVQIESWGSNIEHQNQRARLMIINDITDKAKAEAELQESHRRFEYATKATSDIVWDWDLVSGNVLWADQFQETFGWPLPQDKILPADFCFSHIHADDKTRIISRLKHLLEKQNQPIWEDEFRYQRSDGSYAYVNERGLIIRNEEGKAIRMVGALHDISLQKYHRELQELELKVFELSANPEVHFYEVLKTFIAGMESLHGGASVCITLFSENNTPDILVQQFSARQAIWAKNFINRHKASLQAPGVSPRSVVLSKLEEKDVVGQDHSVQDWKLCWMVPVSNQKNEQVAVLSFFLNQHRAPSEQESAALNRMRNLLRILIISHTAAEQIRLTNERYDNVLKATHDLIWDWNLETGAFFRNTEGVKRVYGVQDEEKIKNVHDWLVRIHEDDHANVLKVINDVLHATDEDTFDVEYRFLRDDGTYANLYDRGIIIRNKDGKPVRMIGAAQDTTHRKRLEQELLQQELDRQKIISQATLDTQEQERTEIGKELHDNVNQVLTTTKLYLELASCNADMKDEMIQKSSANIIHVINEIRQLSRSLMDPSIGDLGLVDSVKDLIENINITRRLKVNLKAEAEIDDLLDKQKKLMVFRIVQEALSNILRHAEASQVKIKLKKQKETMLLSVEDNGIGFEPDGVHKGIGLKNIRNRVYLVNGELLIKSAPGKGCTINIKFPINQTPSN